MTAKILYVAAGSDPSTILWPLVGPASDRFQLVSGTPTVVRDLIVYSESVLTFPDGRLYPMGPTAQGSTFKHVKT
jgi:hypothetical protein